MTTAATVAHRIVDVAGVFAILFALYVVISLGLIARSEDPFDGDVELEGGE